ncbi:MAG: septum formation protein Maf [Alphaproteobacteria bacterium]|nr:septum formation protein Maf [Alphaproteobacteria bacterium]
MLILASRSKARRQLLDQAGLDYKAVPADIDEEAVQGSGLPPAEISARLARDKALAVAALYPEALVIGSDQVLEFEGVCLAKALTKAAAKARLREMGGRSHRLITSVCVVRGPEILWELTDTATLHMADIDDSRLDEYCARAGSALTDTVGGYEIERFGIRLFERIEGDYFSILGLPLLPLLNFLRTVEGR